MSPQDAWRTRRKGIQLVKQQGQWVPHRPCPLHACGGPDGKQCLPLTGVDYDRLDRSCLPGIGPGELTLTMLGSAPLCQPHPLSFLARRTPTVPPLLFLAAIHPASPSSLLSTSEVKGLPPSNSFAIQLKFIYKQSLSIQFSFRFS